MGASSRTRPRARLRGLAFHWNRPLGWTVKCRWLPLTRTALRARLRCPRARADGPRKWKGSLPRRDQHSPSLQDARRAARAVLLAKLEPKRHLDVGMQRPPQRIRTPPDWYNWHNSRVRTDVRTYVRTYAQLSRAHPQRAFFWFSDLNARTPYVTVRQMSERSPRAPAKSAHVRAYLLNQASARVRT